MYANFVFFLYPCGGVGGGGGRDCESEGRLDVILLWFEP